MATPTLIQTSCHPSTAGNPIDVYTPRLPNATLTGNAIIIFVNAEGNGVVPSSITDVDAGNTLTAGPTATDGGQTLSLWYKVNATAGARTFNINFAASTAYVSCVIMEWNNIDTSGTPTDGSSTGTATSNSLSVTSFTPGSDNCLVLNYAIQDGTPVMITSWAAGANYTLNVADILDTQMVQSWFQGTKTATTAPCTKTDASTRRWCSLAVAFKSAAAGSGTARPSGIRIVNCYHASLYGSVGNDGCSASPRTLQFPTVGNLFIAGWQSPDAAHTALSDSINGAWTLGTAVHDSSNGNSGYNQISYKPNVTPGSSMTVTVTFSVGTSGDTLMLLDVVNASITQLDVSASAVGNSLDAADITGATIDPTVANDLIFSVLGVDNSVVTGNSAGVYFLSTTTTPNIGISPVDQNNGYYVWKSLDGNPITSVWQHAGNLNSWAEIVNAFIQQPGLPIMDQEGYRWRADDGSESGATWLASQDTDVSRATLTNTRLRILSNVTNVLDPRRLLWQYREEGDDQWRDI